MADTNNSDLLLSNLFDVKGKVALVTGGGTLPEAKSSTIHTDRHSRIWDWSYGSPSMSQVGQVV